MHAVFLCVLQVLHDIGAKHGVSPSCVASRWALQQPGVSAVILGARNATHLRVGLLALLVRTSSLWHLHGAMAVCTPCLMVNCKQLTSPWKAGTITEHTILRTHNDQHTLLTVTSAPGSSPPFAVACRMPSACSVLALSWTRTTYLTWMQCMREQHSPPQMSMPGRGVDSGDAH
jgi:hypothetical protein